MFSLSAWCRHSRRWIFVVSPILGLLLVYQLLQTKPDAYVEPLQISDEQVEQAAPQPSSTSTINDAPSEPVDTTNCNYIRGMDDILVIMKTGVTEAQEKVPVHLNTTLKCVPNYAIFSDYEEEIAGVRTHDVLRNVQNETKESNPDFGIYNRLQNQGREGLLEADFHDEANGPFGKPGNPGWKLDKWKFVPMIDEALQLQPDAKWYVFIEADTYVVWPNLVAWLSRMNPKRSYYLGSPMQIGSIQFAYGGAGTILSNPAMKKLSKYNAEHTSDVEKFTADNWAGDCVLGQVLRDAGVRLTWSWPMLQTSRVWELDHFADTYNRKPWCYPAVSYHHMDAQDIENFWRFDQEWFGSGKNSLLLHADVFKKVIINDSMIEHENWDNMSAENANEQHTDLTYQSADDCAQQCAQDSDCLQYSFDNGKCMTSKTFIRGVNHSTKHSGWMTKRMQTVLKNMNSCSKIDYVT